MPRKQTPVNQTESGIFATRLSTRIKELGMNQTSLAQATGMQRQTISLYCIGQSNPDTERLSLIAQALDVSADWLLGLSDYPTHQLAETSFESLGVTPHASKMLLSALNPFLGFEEGAMVGESDLTKTIDGLNMLLSSPSFKFFLEAIPRYVKSPRPSRFAEFAMECGVQYSTTDSTTVNIPSGLLKQLYGFQLQRGFNALLDSFDHLHEILETEKAECDAE